MRGARLQLSAAALALAALPVERPVNDDRDPIPKLMERRRAFRTRDGGRAVLIPVDLHTPDAICRKHGTAAKRVRQRVDGRKVKAWLCKRCAEEADR